MKKAILVFSAISLLLSTGCSLLAPVDRSKFSDIEGHVFSLTTKGPVSNAEVTIKEPSVTEKTNLDGTFKMRGLPVDWVNVEIKAEGYETVTRKVKIEPYGIKYMDFYIGNKAKMKPVKAGNILFERDGDIWSTDEYGLSQENITLKVRNQAFDTKAMSGVVFKSPNWMDNKSKIAYIALDNSSNPHTKNGVWIINSAGKMMQRVAQVDTLSNDLTVSTDAQDFIFSMTNPDNSSNIALYKFSSKLNKVTALSGNNLVRDFSPRYSPKKNIISFSSEVIEQGNVNLYDPARFSSRMQIFSMTSDGFNRKQLTTIGDNYDPAWSPDGEKIAFISNRTGSSEIWVMNKDGAGQRKLTNTGATRANSPLWSEDGERIIFNSNYKQKYSSLSASDLWVFELDTYEMRMITNDARKAAW